MEGRETLGPYPFAAQLPPRDFGLGCLWPQTVDPEQHFLQKLPKSLMTLCLQHLGSMLRHPPWLLPDVVVESVKDFRHVGGGCPSL